MGAPRFVGRYFLFRPLAAGGMATVHLGSLRAAAGVSRPVAIKSLHPHVAGEKDGIERFLSEARIVSRIRHPNVVQILDVVVEGEDRLIVMEYVHGASLSQLMASAAESGDLPPWDVVVRIAVDILEGLHAAHEATNEHGSPLMVVHRDVSPQNVMVEAEGRARILDFGIAKALERSFTTANTGAIRGKLAYSAPEQVAGRAVDRRTDVWAVGMVLWEMLAGRRYFEDAEPADIVRRIAAEPVPPPSSVRPCPAALDAIVLRAVDRDPDARYASAREMALALERAGSIADYRVVSRWVRGRARERLDDTARLVDEMAAELRKPATTASVSITGAAVVVPDERRGVLPRRVMAAVVLGLVAVGGAGAALARLRAPVEPLEAVSAVVPPRPSTLVSTAATLASASTPPTSLAAPDGDAGARVAPTAAASARDRPHAGAPRRSPTARPTSRSSGSGASPGARDPLDRDERQ